MTVIHTTTLLSMSEFTDMYSTYMCVPTLSVILEFLCVAQDLFYGPRVPSRTLSVVIYLT